MVSRIAPGERAEQCVGEILHRPGKLLGRYDDVRQAELFRLGRPDHPGGRADLQRPGVADHLDQWLGATQVGDQAERRLLHAEAGHPRRRRAGRRRAPAGSRRRRRTPAPPRYSRTAGRRSHVNPAWNPAMSSTPRRSLRPEAQQRLHAHSSSPMIEHRRSRPAENGGPSPDTTTTRTSGDSAVPNSASARHIAGVCALRTSGRSSTTRATGPSTREPQSQIRHEPNITAE